MSRPTVLIPCDVREVGIHPFHCVGEKYINAIAEGSEAIPLLLPAWESGQDIKSQRGAISFTELLSTVDGVFLPGSPSNIHPGRFGGDESREQMLDPQRDAVTFDLIESCMELDLPVFAVCRGLQELNVALGGTLHEEVHLVSGLHDHREDKDASRDAQYSPSHSITVQSGGLLERLLGTGDFNVNSLHGQGIDQLATRLSVEAVADDGLVEAVSIAGKDVLGVQWHPEWKLDEKEDYKLLFSWFGDRIRHRHQMRVGER